MAYYFWIGERCLDILFFGCYLLIKLAIFVHKHFDLYGEIASRLSGFNFVKVVKLINYNVI